MQNLEFTGKDQDALDRELAELLAENGFDHDDEAMVAHYIAEITENGIRKTYRFTGDFNACGLTDVKATSTEEAWQIFCGIDHGDGYGCSDGTGVDVREL